MTEKKGVTQENFELLLDWLDLNREQAGRKYEKIRKGLIRIFAGRGCHEAEDLADETINRVTLKVSGIIHDYVGEPNLYFYSVAKNIHREWLRRQSKITDLELEKIETNDRAETDVEYDCLEICLEKIPAGQRELIISYYREEKRAKIEHRRILAEKLGIKTNTLQIRLHRIRAGLRACVGQCVSGRDS